MFIKILQIILAIFIGVGGVIKVLRLEFQVQHWHEYQYPMWFLTFTGLMEIISAIAIIAGFWNRYFAIVGSLIVFVFMCGAIYTHIFKVQHSLTNAIPATVCLIISGILMIHYYNNN